MKKESKRLFDKKMKVLFELSNLEAAKSLQGGFNRKANLMLMYKELIKEQLSK